MVPVLAFLITAPTLSPVILLLTYGLFGLDVSIYRLVVSLAYALLVAFAVEYFFKKPPTLQMKMRDSSSKRSAFLEGLKRAVAGGKVSTHWHCDSISDKNLYSCVAHCQPFQNALGLSSDLFGGGAYICVLR
jgi:uncharacterized membrane protein YraQ (UPF0718 family)